MMQNDLFYRHDTSRPVAIVPESRVGFVVATVGSAIVSVLVIVSLCRCVGL